jgi:CubicO group peptidase (beta-lactamase class C family)
MAELMIKADDMAKVGLLVLHRGNWKGRQIIAESWFDDTLISDLRKVIGRYKND